MTGLLIGIVITMLISTFSKNLNLLIFWGFILVTVAILSKGA